MTRLLLLVACLLTLLVPHRALAEPGDIDAAARGVVRVVIIGTDGTNFYPVAHGTGFAVSPTRIVTNAHVVAEALEDETLRIGVVPNHGEGGALARVVTVSEGKDLALLELAPGLRLAPLTLAGAALPSGAEVNAVGYPMNVDQAQGLSVNDIIQPQPPVKSRGFLSDARSSRDVATLLHTAPIARGNSGGPLLDACGRVLGVNSFGAESSGGDAEFFFAIATTELAAFLRASGVEPQINARPCRSLADLDAEDAARRSADQERARAALAERATSAREARERARLEAEMAVLQERENAMAIALVLLLASAGLAFAAWQVSRDPARRRLAIALGAGAGIALVGAAASWLTRPGLAEIDRRALAATRSPATAPAQATARPEGGTLTCTLDEGRSRITGPAEASIAFTWDGKGCVNGRTQYGLAEGEWSRLFAPDSEDVVAINTYDPGARAFRVERYLLSAPAMQAVRAARARYQAPTCNAGQPPATLGERQSEVRALLPTRPNERLYYSCRAE